MPTPRCVLRPASSIGAALLLGLLGACGDAAVTVSTSALEKHLEDNITAPQGFDYTIDCPRALAGKVDATATCTVSDGEDQTGVRFVTTEVDGKDVTFETAPFLDSQTLEAALAEQMTAQGLDVSDIDCPGELDGVVGETTECSGTSSGEERTIEVSVEEIDGLRIRFSAEPVE